MRFIGSHRNHEKEPFNTSIFYVDAKQSRMYAKAFFMFVAFLPFTVTMEYIFSRDISLNSVFVILLVLIGVAIVHMVFYLFIGIPFYKGHSIFRIVVTDDHVAICYLFQKIKLKFDAVDKCIFEQQSCGQCQRIKFFRRGKLVSSYENMKDFDRFVWLIEKRMNDKGIPCEIMQGFRKAKLDNVFNLFMFFLFLSTCFGLVSLLYARLFLW